MKESEYMNSGGNECWAFFVHNMENAVGGMETHAKYFVDYYYERGMLGCVITKNQIWECADDERYEYCTNDEVIDAIKRTGATGLFFNDGYWIEDFEELRYRCPDVVMVMRSGGNEFMKAELQNMNLSLQERRRKWADCINCIDFIISNSSYTTHRMLDIGIRKEKIILVRGGVDVKACKAYAKSRAQLREELCNEYGIDQKSCVIGIVSRLEKFKGIEETIETLTRLKTVKWHLIIAGSGRAKSEILLKLKNCLSSDQYTFVGPLDNSQAMRLIATADCLLNMSVEYTRNSGSETYIHTETMGRSMLEAVCCETPVIASDVGGTSELFQEQPDAGILLEDYDGLNEAVEAVYGRRIHASPIYVDKYDWGAIFENIYNNFLRMPSLDDRQKINLVIDLEGSVTHEFLSDEENKKNFESILGLSDRCNLIINTAGELEDIFRHYPYVAGFEKKITIIANCGKKVLIHGAKFSFWDEYYASLRGPDPKMIEGIRIFLERKGYKVAKISEIDKLYINFKTQNVSDDVLSELTLKLKNTAFEVCKNDNNVKLISEEIEKGNTLRFLCCHVLHAEKSIGVGNGILDESFLNICEKAYFVNQAGDNPHYEYLKINDSLSMSDFIKRLINDIG